MAESGIGLKYSGIRICRDPEDLSREAAGLFAELAGRASQGSRWFTVALSGGQTPRRTYELLGSPSFRDRLTWDCVHVFWGDERMVPSDNPDSNYKMVWDAFLSKVPLPSRNVHPVKTEGGSAKTVATQYDRHLQEFFKLRPGEWPVFDLVILGLGIDGHTASLFPGNSALEESQASFTSCTVEALRVDRLTMTLPVLNHARQVIFLVSGVEKAGVLKEIVEGRSTSRPAGFVSPISGNLLWLVDEAAASRFSSAARMTAQRSLRHKNDNH